ANAELPAVARVLLPLAFDPHGLSGSQARERADDLDRLDLAGHLESGNDIIDQKRSERAFERLGHHGAAPGVGVAVRRQFVRTCHRVSSTGGALGPAVPRADTSTKPPYRESTRPLASRSSTIAPAALPSPPPMAALPRRTSAAPGAGGASMPSSGTN